MKKSLLFLIPLLLGISLSACGPSGEGSQPVESEPPLKDFTDVYFDSKTVTYNGSAHILDEVRGAPTGTTITYSGRDEFADVGVYSATALLSKEGYNNKTLDATLTITQANYTGLTYESKTVIYDGKEHINDIQLTGVLPKGTSVNEAVRNSDNEIVASAIEVGTYTYTCTLSNPNYVTPDLTATLTIKAQKKDMPVFVTSDGTIYFSNGLHNSYIYSYTETETKLLDYSSPREFNKYSSDTALFVSGAALLSSVKEITSGEAKVLYTDSNISDFVKQSDTIYYYSSNSLTASKSGIYKVDATNTEEEPIVTKIFTGKSDNLAIHQGKLYFTNGNDQNHVYRYNLSTQTTEKILAEKVHEFVISGSRLYCTVNGLVNDFIGYTDLSSSNTSITKLTNAAGEYLTIKDGYLYYNYTDLFSYVDSSVKGVWKISVNGGDPVQVLATENVNGFDVESSNSIVYIDTEDLHLYRYNVTSKTSVDLLKGFVAPEVVPINTGGKTVSLGSKIYYLNMYAGKTLYVYDEVTRKNSQLTTNKVTDFYIYNGIMYFNQVTMLVNNDIYSVNVTLGGEATKINSNDIRDMVSDGEYIYAAHYNWAGIAGGLSRMKLDGTEYVKFSEVNNAKNLTIREDSLYYIKGLDNGNIEYISTASITETSEKLAGTNLSKNIKNVKQFAFDGNDIFYAYDGAFENSIRRTDFTSLDSGTAIASSDTNPHEFVIYGDYVYYYSIPAMALAKSGFYKVSKTATKDKTQELILGYGETYYGSSLSVADSNNLYFLNYISPIQGDAHFYQLNLTSKQVVKIA